MSIWLKVPNVVCSELTSADFPSVLRYSATCIRRCAKQMQGDDASDRDAKRANMRAHARRLVNLAESLDRAHRPAKKVRR